METTIWQTYPQDEVIVVGIINTSNQNQINNFIEENSLTFPILFDPGSPGGVQGGDTYNDYYLPNDGSPYPRDFIVDQEGILQYANNEIDTEWMHYVLDECLSEPQLMCGDGEVDLGWGNCNEITGSSITPDGCMPSGCFSIEETNELNFSYVNLGQFPSNIDELTNLSYIHISDCGLYGSLPASIGDLNNIESLQVYDNDHDLPDSLNLDSQLTGLIPQEIGNLESLKYLRLENNNLSGQIPSEIGELDSLVFLLLGGNELEGEIPASLMNLLGLASLSLNDNQLTGHIPLEIAGLVNLETIDISNNQLTGEIPEGLSIPADLYYVNLSNNQLTGYITEQFCDMHFVDFSGNRFCAPYPQCYSEEELGIQDTSSCGGLFSFPIEGRWVLEMYTNTMYEFVDGLRLTYYCTADICDSTYWNSLDSTHALPTQNPYTFINDTLIIDLFFGSIFEEEITFLCDGKVVDFNSQQSNWYRVGTDIDGCEDYDGQQLDISSAITVPKEINLHQNYPNPFNPITLLGYDLPDNGFVNITIYDLNGRVIRTLVNSYKTAGYHLIEWNATNGKNEPVSQGIYVYTIQTGGIRQSKKMVLLK
tara:strand:- start:369 stop:2147 length:1779 start_codon:yes stop_codon:yes gene_type:complete